LKTDHRNLTFINEDKSSKVQRWKMAIQHWNTKWIYIQGKDNEIADAFSRLCPSGKENECEMLNGLWDREMEYVCELHDVLNDKEDEHIDDEYYKCISSVHNSVAGHHGVERTMAKLLKCGFQWDRMRAHVKTFIKKCPLCQKADFRRVDIQTRPFTTSARSPMEWLAMDSMGPLRTDEFGNSYILVIICCFTRFVELYPIPDVGMDTCARVLLQHIGRYGAPCRMVSDGGSQFVNGVVEELLKLIGTEHQISIPYSHEENGLVERANKEAMRHLRGIIYDKKVLSNWSMYLPLVQRIMNASVHSATMMSPAELLFGNAIALDMGIFLPQRVNDNENNPIEITEWAEDMLRTQAELIRIAAKVQHEKDMYHIRKAMNDTPTEFPVNTYVLVSYPDTGFRSGPPTKLLPVWRGPMRVIAATGDKYTVQNLITDRKETVHITRLKQFVYDPIRTDPTKVAMTDDQSFVIEKILKHKGDTKYKSSMKFLVRWQGYDETDDTWEPWSGLRDTEQLHAYLLQNKLGRLIPKEFQNKTT
jgi:hypothetical protein